MSAELTTSWIHRWEAIRRRLPAVNPVIMGHPLHALATDLPAALIPTGFAFSLWGRLARQPDLEKAGYLNTAAGVVMAIPTALFGLADYLQMEVDDPAQTTGLTHGLLNVTAIGIGIASLAGRSLRKPGSGRGVWLGGISTVVLLASAYLGGDLVYHRGWAREADRARRNRRAPGSADRARRRFRVTALTPHPALPQRGRE